MMQMFPNMGSAVEEMKEKIEEQAVIKDPQVVPHLAALLGKADTLKAPSELVHLSNVVKQTRVQPKPLILKPAELPIPLLKVPTAERPARLIKFSSQNEQLRWTGYAFSKEEAYMVDKHLSLVAEMFKAEEVRFWGKILGLNRDYYIIQGRTNSNGGMETIGREAEKRGEGVNYYSFWVSNNILLDQWTELPLVTPEQVKNARKIKKNFTGDLHRPIVSYPLFAAEERFYLKAQLVRMTSSLEIVPKGIYKLNDENPKIVQFEDQVKIPEFAELSSPETWVHRNQNLLNMGRCSYYIDPATPEDQRETLEAELAEKDPIIERFRGITEDKLAEGHPFGIENIWQVRVAGDTQVFQKQEANNVYGVVGLRNVFWPGWITIGYKGGFCNFYVGYGHKWTQTAWSEYENGRLGEQADDAEECHEPTPKDEPKPPEEKKEEEENQQEQP